jgi:hypothetical protein
MSKSEKPKRLFGLGWIEVEGLRPTQYNPDYSGWVFLNLDQVAMIKFPENQPGVAFVVFGNGHSESLEEANHARLLKAIEDAEVG